MSDAELLFEVRDGTAWITINREMRRNAISPEIIDGFNTHLDAITQDDAIRTVCITGAGEKAFCSGADLGLGGDVVESTRKYAALLERMVSYPKPLVARLNGACIAGGMGLMLACDIAYAREEIKLGTPEVKVGLFPMMIGALIFRNAGRKKALEMIYSGELMRAPQAEAMGLITRCYPDTAALDEAVNATLAAIGGNAPVAIRIGRQALAAVDDLPLSEALSHLCEKLGEVLQTEDAMEGLSAFMEKRKPNWKGR